MKKHIAIFLILTLMLSVFSGFGSVAHAAGVTLGLSKTSVDATAGQKIELKANITTDTNLENYRIVCSQYSLLYESGAPLAGGGEYDFSFTVTDAMLGKTLTFKVEYQVSGSSDWAGGGTATLKVNSKEQTVEIGATAAVSPSGLADAGKPVTFTFTIQNKGQAKLTDIVVKAPGLKNGKALNDAFELEAGKTKKVTYEHTVTTAATIKPVVYYKVNGAGDTLSYETNTVELKLSLRNVSMTVTASNENPDPGEEVTFELTLTNGGNVPYTNLVVTMNGEKVKFPSTKLAAKATYTQKYTESFQASTEVVFNVSLTDQNNEVQNLSKTVDIELPVDEAELNSKLKLKVEVDKSQLTSAGKVNFNGYITNGTAYTLSDLAVNETTLGDVYSYSLLAAGGNQSFEYEANLSKTTTFQFVLTVKDAAGKEYTVKADPITVTVASGTTPTATASAGASQSGIPLDGSNKHGLDIVLIIAIVLVVLIIGVGVALFVLWKGQRSGKGVSFGSGKTATPKKTLPSKGAPRKRGPYTKGYRDRNNF